MSKTRTRLVHEGDYVAEVDVQLVECDEPWSPYLTLGDAEKLDEVRKALRQRDFKRASELARVFELTPIES